MEAAALRPFEAASEIGAKQGGTGAQGAYHGAGRSPHIQAKRVKRGIRTMNFMQAVQSCLSQYATFSGRAPRSEFWWFFLFQILVLIVAGMLGQTAYSVVALLLLLPALAVGTRRLHDVGRSGWWQLLTITGIGYLVLLYWFVQPGEAQSNGYGETSVT